MWDAAIVREKVDVGSIEFLDCCRHTFLTGFRHVFRVQFSSVFLGYLPLKPGCSDLQPPLIQVQMLWYEPGGFKR